jgi:uracil-DNA glycosylase
MSSLPTLLDEVRACTRCEAHLPHGPRPVVQVGASARILIAGQAPGRKVHESGIPFDDASGERLRAWLGLSRELFYDADRVAILPMGFCFPGTGRAGDLPPRPECAPTWRARLMSRLNHLQLTLVVGQYAQAYHLPDAGASLTHAVQAWRDTWPTVVALPHPSPRNNLWLKRNAWFERELVPLLRERVAQVLADSPGPSELNPV